MNFDRLPGLTAAFCRRIWKTPSWHFFDDQGTLDFENRDPAHLRSNAPGMTASEFVGFIYKKIGRPSKPSTHLPPAQVRTHLGLQNMLQFFGDHHVSLTVKPGKLEAIYDSLKDLQERRSQQATLGELMVLGGTLIFLLMSCFDTMARGVYNLSSIGCLNTPLTAHCRLQQALSWQMHRVTRAVMAVHYSSSR